MGAEEEVDPQITQITQMEELQAATGDRVYARSPHEQPRQGRLI